MKANLLVSVLSLLAAVMTATPQEARSQQQTAAPPSAQSKETKPIAPDEQAFRDALATKDPDAKLRAFQKLVKEWPNSRAVTSGAADFNILSLEASTATTATKAAREAAEAYIARMPDNRDLGAWQNMLVAMALARTDAMWPEVEHYARRSLEYWDSGGTSERPLHSGIALERALPLTVLGQAVAKQGRDDEAERYLRQAYQARADEPGVVGQAVPLLLDIAKRRDRADEQVEYLIALALYGRLTPALRADLEASYRHTHGGSLDGLEDMLDARYEAELPKAIPVEPFVRPAQAGARTVLAEMFTGASCAPCVGMDLAIEAAMRRYGTRDLAVLVYHVHSPAPDPLVNPSGETRAKMYSFSGAPHTAVDGAEFDDEGGGKAAEAGTILRTRLQPAIDRAMQEPARARLSLRTSRTGNVIRATVAVDQLPKGAPGLRLHVALVEERVRYSGGNGIRFHPMVVRKMAGGGAGLPVAASRATKTDVIFDIPAIRNELKAYLDDFEKKGNANFAPSAFSEKKTDVDDTKLLLVAFLQEEASHRVLQAVVEGVGSSGQQKRRP